MNLDTIKEIGQVYIRYGQYSNLFDEFVIKYGYNAVSKAVNLYISNYYSKRPSGLDDELLKYYYDICEKLEWSVKKINEYADKLGIPSENLKEYAREYAIRVLGISEFELQDMISEIRIKNAKQNIKPSRYVEACKLLIKEDDIDKIKDIFQMFEIKPNILKETVKRSERFKEQFKNVENFQEIILAKTKMYENLLKSENKNNLTKTETRSSKLIREFINGNYNSKEEFISKKNMSFREFSFYLGAVKKGNNELFQEYQKKLKLLEQKNKIKSLAYIPEILNMLKNGVIDSNGQVREFDLIDYFMMVDLDFESLVKGIREDISVEDLKIFRKFTQRNKYFTENFQTEINEFLNSTLEVNCEFDNNGNSIANSGRIITQEEKTKIMEFLIENHIPLNRRTFSIALKRYLNNNLFVDYEPLKENIRM